MTTASVASVHEAAAEFLNTVEAALQTTAVGFDGVTWLNPGFPSLDVQCDFATVWQGATNFATSAIIPSSQLMRTGPRIDLVTLNATFGRCVNVSAPMGIPLPAQKTADALIHMEDGQAVWVGVQDEIASGDLFGGTCKQITLQGLNAITPEGGVSGWNLVVLVQIDGYPVSL